MVLVFVVAAGAHVVQIDISAEVAGVVIVVVVVVGISFASAVGTVRYYDPQIRRHHWQDRYQQLNQSYGVDSRLTDEEI